MYAQPTDSGFLGRARSNPSFSDLVIGLLRKIDARRADSAEEREAIFRLRYDAYRREGVIPANPSATFSDAYDQTPNAYLFGLYIEGKLASSIRIHVASKRLSRLSFARRLFRIFCNPSSTPAKSSSTRTALSPTRPFLAFMWDLPYATLRLCHLSGRILPCRRRTSARESGASGILSPRPQLPPAL